MKHYPLLTIIFILIISLISCVTTASNSVVKPTIQVEKRNVRCYVPQIKTTFMSYDEFLSEILNGCGKVMTKVKQPPYDIKVVPQFDSDVDVINEHCKRSKSWECIGNYLVNLKIITSVNDSKNNSIRIIENSYQSKEHAYSYSASSKNQAKMWAQDNAIRRAKRSVLKDYISDLTDELYSDPYVVSIDETYLAKKYRKKRKNRNFPLT